MKLLIVFTAILAISFAKEKREKREIIEDSQAEASASFELLKEGADLKTAASNYNTFVPPSQRPPKWNAPNYIPPQNNWIQPYEEKANAPEVQSDEYHHHHYYPAPVQQWPNKPVQQWTTQAPQWTTPAPQWTTQAPQWTTKPAQWTTKPAQWTSPAFQPSTTTPVAVIKNEQYYGDNGDYKYEYQIADGTHVGEQGYYTDPKQTDDSLVKKGWYSFVGADGKTYTVHYWADKTGYHAYGDHLPTPPTPHPAIQAAIDKQKEEEKNKPQNKPQNDYPTQTQAPVYYPTQTPVYNPQPTYPQQTYPQQTYPQQTYPQQTYPQQTYPQHTYPQQTYPQQTNPQQTYPQQNYNPQQTYPSQQNYYPQQQTYA